MKKYAPKKQKKPHTESLADIARRTTRGFSLNEKLAVARDLEAVARLVRQDIARIALELTGDGK